MSLLGRIFLSFLGVIAALLLIIIGLHLANDLFQFIPDTGKPILLLSGEKYEIYRDLLILLLSAIGVVGYFLYTEAKKHLTEDLLKSQKNLIENLEKSYKLLIEDTKKSVRKEEFRHLATLYNHLSDLFWQQYVVTGEPGEPGEPEDLFYKTLVDLAISEAELAVEYLEKLEGWEAHRSALRVNFAYHLAVRKNEEDKDKALKLIRENWVKAIEVAPAQEYNFRESRIWVILRYSDDKEEIEDAGKEIQALMEWTTIPIAWKEKMKEKYKKFLEFSLTIPS